MGERIAYISTGSDGVTTCRDASIFERLTTEFPNAEIRVVSYGVGASALLAHGVPVIDLGLSPNDTIWDFFIRVLHELRRYTPDVILVREECIAVPAGKALGVPVVFLCDGMTNSVDPVMQCLHHAAIVDVLRAKGACSVPPFLRGKTRFADSSPWIAPSARMSHIVVCAETLSPHARETVVAALDRIPNRAKRSLWLMDKGAQGFGSRPREESSEGLPSLMTTADVIVGGSSLVRSELYWGSSSSSILIVEESELAESWRLSNLSGNTILRSQSLDPALLAEHLLAAASRHQVSRSGMCTAICSMLRELLQGPVTRAPKSSPILLLSGIPGSGKSTFGRWLAAVHNFVHLDLEVRGVLEEADLVAQWNHMFSPYGSVDPFCRAIKRFAAPVVLDWGFPFRKPGIAEALMRNDIDIWWFDGDRTAAKAAFDARGTTPSERFDQQIQDIDHYWPRVTSLVGDQMVRVIDRERFLRHEEILSYMKQQNRRFAASIKMQPTTTVN